MAKVREVLERIGDKPLIEALQERGFSVYSAESHEDTLAMVSELKDAGYTVFDEDPSYDDVADYARDLGIPVLEEDADLEAGFHLYRNRNTEGFRLWLRALFWNGLGRIV